MQLAMVEVKATNEVMESIFIGTTGSAGHFSEHSIVQEIGGKMWRSGELVRSVSIGALRFEAVQALHLHSQNTQFDVPTFWNAMAREATAVQEAHMWVRCRRSVESDAPSATKLRFCLLEKRGLRTYAKFTRDAVYKFLESGNLQGVLDAVEFVFKNDEGKLEMSRDSSGLAMIVLDMTARLKKSAMLSYDSLQHSAQIFLSAEPARIEVAAGRCAYVRTEKLPGWEIAWESQSWTPIANGMVLVGEK